MARPTLLPLGLLVALLHTACTDSPVTPEDSTSSSTSSSTSPSTGTSQGPSTTADTTASATTSTTGDTGLDSGSSSGSTTGSEPAGPFQFARNGLDDYTQVDRVGIPGVNTGLNLLGDKDAYNAGSPADDAALVFAANIFESMETLHLGAPGMHVAGNTGLDDDLMSLGLEPCVPPPLPMDNCDDQGGPLAIPDTLFIDLDIPAGFPNGRALDYPVMDAVLAVLLLDLDAHDISTFSDLDEDGTPGPSLNPLANDVELPVAWPYLAPPHQ